MATRILLLTQWFDPEPTFKGLIFARELVQRGFDVEVITGFPNYPGGNLYPGYKMKIIQREIIDGVHVTRVPLFPSHDSSAIGRIINYITFSASALFYGLFWAKKPCVIYAYHPPLTVGVAAVLIRLIRRVPLVYDIQDMWPDTLRATGMIKNEWALRVVSAVCLWVYRNVDQIVVLSPGFKQLLVQRGVSGRKIDVIYNWCDEKSLKLPAGNMPLSFPDEDKFRIMFAGNMGKAQALDAVLDAALLLMRRNINEIVFVFVGDGIDVDRLKTIAKEKCLTNTLFLPSVPMIEVGDMLNAADALLVHLRKDPLFEITIPSKTQAYMSVGRPVLMAVSGDAADLVRESGCGVIAISEDPESIVHAAIKLLNTTPTMRNMMSVQGRKFYQEKLSLAVGVSKFSEIFRKLSQKGCYL